MSAAIVNLPRGEVIVHAFRISALAARLGLASLVVATPTNATAGGRDSARAALSTVASWQMNEAAGTSVMGDSSGHGMTGSIGAHIQTHQTFDGAVGYRWVFRKPEEPPADPQRLVQVANRSALNPGTGTYVVTIRMRTTQDFGNIVQKGQAGAKGGYWKLENPHGVVHCLFRGPSKVGINVDSGMAINDGKWHVIRCERTSSGVNHDGRRPSDRAQERFDREHLEPQPGHDRRQAQLRPAHRHLRLLHRIDRLHHDSGQLTRGTVATVALGTYAQGCAIEAVAKWRPFVGRSTHLSAPAGSAGAGSAAKCDGNAVP
jgi:hypothetical protein